MSALADRVREALETVYDPELPSVRITDLGVVEAVRAGDDAVEIDLLPTFSGCPALDVIRRDVEAAVARVAGDRAVRVTFRRDLAWTTDRMSDAARAALAGYGVAPPGTTLIQIGVRCPYCGSPRTRVESAFGPTACRDIRYCDACRNPFEGFKPKLVS